MLTENDKAYIAGLFDGEGHVSYKKYPKKRKGIKKDYTTWNIGLEISMTDKNIIELVHETLMCGSIAKKPPGKGQMGKKMQYRWLRGSSMFIRSVMQSHYAVGVF